VNQRLVAGVFLLAISLALVGAAATARGIPEETIDERTLGSAVVSVQSVGAAETQVPLRSAFLDGDETTAVDLSATPVAVRIGQISLEAPVIPVGVDEANEFDVPAADTVGWYQHSPAPGHTVGSTVLAAHVDYGGREGAFFSLENVTIGEILQVEMADGSTLEYEVTETVLYDKVELPAEELFRKTGDPVLRLITCGGTFDSEERSYRGNLVVTAVPMST
jgi:sortase (surface protein transpeptidase)